MIELNEEGLPNLDMRYVDDIEIYRLWFQRNFIDCGRDNLPTFEGLPVLPVVCGGRVEFVDAAMAELVHELWRAGIDIADSVSSLHNCPTPGENGVPTAMLNFANQGSMFAFLMIVAIPDAAQPEDEASLTMRMTDGGHPASPMTWEWHCMPHMDGRTPFLTYTALFPLTDVMALVARVKRFLDGVTQ